MRPPIGIEWIQVQMKPDFTGRWTFNPAGSVLQIPAPDETLFVMDHNEPPFRITRTHVIGDVRDTFSLDLTTDGQQVSAERGEVTLHSRAYWEGETLVFDTSLIRAGEEATNMVRYSLSANRFTFVAEERFRSKSLNYDNLWLFDRIDDGAARPTGA